MRTMRSVIEETDTVVAPSEPVTLAEGGALPVWHRRRSRAAWWHRGVARVLLGCLTLQLFFAGLGIFTTSGFLPHAIMGSAIILGSFALPLIAWRGRLGPALTRRSWLLAALMVLQGLLIDAGRISHVITALHPVNAMLLVLITFSMAL
ncbi:MAG TPA: DUF6220 domain-containing protein [Ktedonobacterales bacterium]|jgi:hypothetical protein|nr:DUF6220 domain-containing protein [Ktedonobacterales bacterium]